MLDTRVVRGKELAAGVASLGPGPHAATDTERVAARLGPRAVLDLEHKVEHLEGAVERDKSMVVKIFLHCYFVVPVIADLILSPIHPQIMYLYITLI